MYAYVGSRTTKERNARGEGISVYRVDEELGTLSLIQQVKGLVNPSFLAMNRDNTHLYTVHGDRSEVSAFRIDSDTGELTLINQQSCQGKNPVHLAFDPSEQYLVISNHLSGELAVMEIMQDGSLGEVVQRVVLSGSPGPHRVEQGFSKPHFNLFSPDGRQVIVPDKGLDAVFSFEFNQGKLTPSAQPVVACRETSGPRHSVFHPSANYLYVVNELDSTVGVYRWEDEDGQLTPIQVITSLPTEYTGNSRASEIVIDAQGHYLYASNRGADNIAVYRIDPDSGLLCSVGFCETGGKTPRFFTLTPNGKYIFALNEDSDSIVTLKIDPVSGLPQATEHVTYSGSPVCMIFTNQ